MVQPASPQLAKEQSKCLSPCCMSQASLQLTAYLGLAGMRVRPCCV